MEPLIPPSATSASPAAASQAPVLVVDDDQMSVEVLVRFLRRHGMTVVAVARGDAVLARARQVRPRAILLDVNLPGMDGWQVLTALKADAELAAIPVLMTTINDERNRGLALGASDYMVKPLDLARLAAALHLAPSAPGPRPKEAQPAEAPPAESRPILIVDDDRTGREVLRRMLQKAGCQVIEAENGAQALERVSTTPPALILLDLRMPVMDGFAFVEEIQKHAEFRSVPVVALTAKDLTAEDRRRLQGSVAQVMKKGEFGREELLRAVRNSGGTGEAAPLLPG